MFGNDFSNATALFELSTGGSMRINELRRVGYPSHISRVAASASSAPRPASSSWPRSAVWQDKEAVTDVSEQLATQATLAAGRSGAGRRRPGPARRLHLRARPPCTTPDAAAGGVRGLHNGHEGSHHFLVDDFVTAVNTGTLPPVNAWEAARYTLPGIVAHESALRGGERLPVPDFGDAPVRLPAQGINEEGFAGELRR